MSQRTRKAKLARVGQLIEARRLELGYTLIGLAQRAGISGQTLTDLRYGRTTTAKPLTAYGLDSALRWKHGSLERTLRGGKPVNEPLTAAGDDRPSERSPIQDIVDEADGMTPEQVQAGVQYLRFLKEQAERKLAE